MMRRSVGRMAGSLRCSFAVVAPSNIRMQRRRVRWVAGLAVTGVLPPRLMRNVRQQLET